MQEFAISAEQLDPETAVISLQGEVDLSNAAAFEAELMERLRLGASRVVIDLERATFFDSTALRVLLVGHRDLTARGGNVYVVCDNAQIRKIFSITGLEELFPFHLTVAEALGSPQTFNAVA